MRVGGSGPTSGAEVDLAAGSAGPADAAEAPAAPPVAAQRGGAPAFPPLSGFAAQLSAMAGTARTEATAAPAIQDEARIPKKPSAQLTRLKTEWSNTKTQADKASTAYKLACADKTKTPKQREALRLAAEKLQKTADAQRTSYSAQAEREWKAEQKGPKPPPGPAPEPRAPAPPPPNG